MSPPPIFASETGLYANEKLQRRPENNKCLSINSLSQTLFPGIVLAYGYTGKGKIDMNSKRLLLVDDESIFLKALRKMLQAPDVDVDTAETLGDARVLLRRHAYDVVITDLRLAGTAGQEGLDIVRIVKENRSRTKVILMTAYGDNEVRLKASFLGADLYLEKPVSIEVMRKSLENLAEDGEGVRLFHSQGMRESQ